MSTTSTTGPGGLGTAAQSLSLPQRAAAGAAIATLVNVALWAGGRAADVSFMVSGSLVTQVGILLVALTTLLTFAVGTGPARIGRSAFPPMGARPPRRGRPVRRGLGGRSPVGSSRHRNWRAAGGDAPGDRRRLLGHRVEGGDPMIGVSPLPGCSVQ